MTQSEILFKEAQQYFPGGVNSPVRAFGGVGGTPLFFKHGKGPLMWDADDRPYIDYVGSWGALVLGHAHPDVIAAVHEAADHGLSFGAPSVRETRLAQALQACVPSLERMRLVSSGTEATMTAIRLARGYTKRSYLIKFEGCYHGHHDSLLIKAGSGALTFGVPTSAGVPEALAQYTLVLPFNDAPAVLAAFAAYPNQIAAIIVEPVAGNMGCVPPLPGFLETLRQACTDNGAVLIFDEVMTGFRVALGGAQARYAIHPDLSTFGKVIGGGMPVGAVGGRADIMRCLAPEGPVYQAGTLSGNPVAVSAGLAMLQVLQQPEMYVQLAAKTQTLHEGFVAAAKTAGVPLCCQSVPGMFSFFFTSESKVSNYQAVQASDTAKFKTFFHAMLKEGVYMAPSAYEAHFVSLAHDDAVIAQTLSAVTKVFQALV